MGHPALSKSQIVLEMIDALDAFSLEATVSDFHL